MRKHRRLHDAYRFPVFRPGSTVRGSFGDPKARILRLEQGGGELSVAPAGRFTSALPIIKLYSISKLVYILVLKTHNSDKQTRIRERLEALGIRGSMGRTRNPYDNAQMESFFKTLKHEELYACEYKTMQDVLERMSMSLEEPTNRRSSHSSLEYVPNEEYELVHAKLEGKNPEFCMSK